MDLAKLQNLYFRYIDEAPENRVSREDAIRGELAGLRLFDQGLLGAASAQDPLFLTLRDPAIVHPEVFMPQDWLRDAQTVISFFLPFSEAIRHANTLSRFYPADEWLHGRIEGQMMVAKTSELIRDQLILAGFEAVVPATDQRFHMLEPYQSNWSERHVAYICGLGTFSLSKGLITEKGVAGRFGSVVTNCPLQPVTRPYTDPFQYCTRCGACANSCPVLAIDATRGILLGKAHPPCSAYLDKLKLEPHGPNHRVRYGCGKCQTGVPCESRNPSAVKED